MKQIIAFLITWCAVWALILVFQKVNPTVKPASSSKYQFSEERALKKWRRLAQKTRIRGFGTPAELLSNEYFENALKKKVELSEKLHQSDYKEQVKVEFLKFKQPIGSNTLQMATKLRYYSYSNCTNYFLHISTNKLERLPKEQKEKNAVYFSCHTDSFAIGPGANDDALPCMIQLEVIKNLIYELNLMQRKNPDVENLLKHDIYFAFVGGEEFGFLGSHSLLNDPIQKAKIWDYVGAFINSEVYGYGGHEWFFRATDAWMMKQVQKGYKYPVGKAIFQDLFENGIVASDTDYTTYDGRRKFPLHEEEEVLGRFIPQLKQQKAKRKNIVSGLDVSQTKNSGVYHTQFDDFEHYEPGTIQRWGENYLSLSKHLMLKVPEDFPAHEKLVKLRNFVKTQLETKENNYNQMDPASILTTGSDFDVLPVFFTLFDRFLFVFRLDTLVIFNYTVIAIALSSFCVFLFGMWKKYSIFSILKRFSLHILISVFVLLGGLLFPVAEGYLIVKILKKPFAFYSQDVHLITLYFSILSAFGSGFALKFLFSCIIPAINAVFGSKYGQKYLDTTELAWFNTFLCVAVLAWLNSKELASSYIFTIIVASNLIFLMIIVRFFGTKPSKSSYYQSASLIFGFLVPAYFLLDIMTNLIQILVPTQGTLLFTTPNKVLVGDLTIRIGIAIVTSFTMLIGSQALFEIETVTVNAKPKTKTPTPVKTAPNEIQPKENENDPNLSLPSEEKTIDSSKIDAVDRVQQKLTQNVVVKKITIKKKASKVAKPKILRLIITKFQFFANWKLISLIFGVILICCFKFSILSFPYNEIFAPKRMSMQHVIRFHEKRIPIYSLLKSSAPQEEEDDEENSEKLKQQEPVGFVMEDEFKLDHHYISLETFDPYPISFVTDMPDVKAKLKNHDIKIEFCDKCTSYDLLTAHGTKLREKGLFGLNAQILTPQDLESYKKNPSAKNTLKFNKNTLMSGLLHPKITIKHVSGSQKLEEEEILVKFEYSPAVLHSAILIQTKHNDTESTITEWSINGSQRTRAPLGIQMSNSMGKIYKVAHMSSFADVSNPMDEKNRKVQELRFKIGNISKLKEFSFEMIQFVVDDDIVMSWKKFENLYTSVKKPWNDIVFCNVIVVPFSFTL